MDRRSAGEPFPAPRLPSERILLYSIYQYYSCYYCSLLLTRSDAVSPTLSFLDSLFSLSLLYLPLPTILSILPLFWNPFFLCFSILSNSLLFTSLLYSTSFSLATTVSVGAGSAHQNLSPYPIPLPHYTPSLTTPSILSLVLSPIQPHSAYLYARLQRPWKRDSSCSPG